MSPRREKRIEGMVVWVMVGYKHPSIHLTLLPILLSLSLPAFPSLHSHTHLTPNPPNDHLISTRQLSPLQRATGTPRYPF